MTVNIRRGLMRSFSRRQLILGAGGAVAATSLLGPRAARADSTGISHSAECIHQEPSFNASRKRLYDALAQSKQFDWVVRLSAAMQSPDMQARNSPTEISEQAGGAFSAFGGYISGRQIELVPEQLLVQAWRAGSWNLGVYSIARFELIEHGSQTMINFDHTGFPLGQADHLAAGWEANYWEPLRKYLSQR